jgi:hypothetical protein
MVFTSPIAWMTDRETVIGWPGVRVANIRMVSDGHGKQNLTTIEKAKER